MIHTFTPCPWRLLTICLLVNWSPSWIMSCALYPVWTLLWIELPSCVLCFWWELPRRASAPKFHILIKSQRWAPQKGVCSKFHVFIMDLGCSVWELLSCKSLVNTDRCRRELSCRTSLSSYWDLREISRSGNYIEQAETYMAMARSTEVRLHVLPPCSQVAHIASMQPGCTYCLHPIRLHILPPCRMLDC